MKVGIIMGSKSDWPTMKLAAEMLDQFGVAYETKVVSAHRTPQLLADYANSAKERGIKVIIAGAGGAARADRPRAQVHAGANRRAYKTGPQPLPRSHGSPHPPAGGAPSP